MARIRSLKPEFWTNEQVMNLSSAARLAFIGMWTFSDDGGNHPASARTLKAEVFPSDDVTAVNVQALVDEMVDQGLVALYSAGPKTYWHVTGWSHQRIEKPTYKYPVFPGSDAAAGLAYVDASTNGRRVVVDHSTINPRGLDPGVEWSGVEGKGKETEKPDKSRDALPPGFADYWKTWPSGPRKQARGECLKVWKKAGAEACAAAVLAHVESLKLTSGWTKDNGEYVPAPLVYLNRRSWEGAEFAQAPVPESFV